MASPLKFCRCTMCKLFRTKKYTKSHLRAVSRRFRHRNKMFIRTREFDKIEDKISAGYLA